MLLRLLQLVPVAFGVTTLVFLLLHLIPGDPVDLMLGEQALTTDRQALRRDLGLDRPLPEQFTTYLGRLAGGDLGTSLSSRRPVANEIAGRLPASAELMVAAMLVALGVAVPLGIAAAVWPHGWVDTMARTAALLGLATPNFWLGPLLILIFAIRLDWLPLEGRGGPDHLVLPAITLGTSMAAILTRMVRTSMLEVLGEDFIRSARAKGLSEWRVVCGHALPAALLPVITVVGLQAGNLLSGAVITESIFGWPGLGTLLLEGIHSRNYPLVQGCVLVIAAIYVLVNLLTDLLYTWADPRIRIR